MKRREFFEKTGIGSATLATVSILGDRVIPAAQAQGHSHGAPITGPLANATVTFGAWQTSPPFDRFVNPNDRFRNHHAVAPFESKIKAGGTVNFIISGFHLLLIYGNGMEPQLIDKSDVIPGVPPLINDDTNRIYRGNDPRVMTQDRVEAVHFANPGRYLVICGVLPHFEEGMFGYVNVNS